jgi:hypothetical protein
MQPTLGLSWHVLQTVPEVEQLIHPPESPQFCCAEHVVEQHCLRTPGTTIFPVTLPNNPVKYNNNRIAKTMRKIVINLFQLKPFLPLFFIRVINKISI